MNLPDFESMDEDDLAIVVDSMPVTMAPVIKMLGLKYTIAFLKAFAGQVFVMPKCPRGAGWERFEQIEQAVGIDAALQLSKEFGGEKLLVPRLAIAIRKLRNRKIIRDFDAATQLISAGRAFNELATKYSLSLRQVENIVNSNVNFSPR